ncbi:MAG: GTP cyclohydrolase I FolE [Bacteroidetes bacterium]|nr:GTP cyclohydrolase I FolE [Bacteroidota bacterium]MDA1119735.1 GTP cyclohydrolase I FolE [Bacteroidota bacterium]
MKLKETLLNTSEVNLVSNDDLGDDHVATSSETPLRPDAFELDDKLKIELIAKHFKEIMQILGLDLTDDSLKGTPNRVAKMYVKEAFSGLNPKNKPRATLFENKFNYKEMIVEKDITFFSHCEHHFVPIYGKVHVAYISSGNVIGLSKINRIVQYYAKRPQVQERMTIQIADELQSVLKTNDVGVVVDANHMCVSSRGVADTNSKTGTAYFSGKFDDENVKKEFLNYINAK